MTSLPPPPDFATPGFAFGGVTVSGRALMAPMMGYNEAPLRRLCRRFGSGLAVTEMVKPEKLLRRDPFVLRDLEFGDDERPLGVQLAVREPELLLPALAQLAPRGFDFVDLNMGCPLKKECNLGFGAALLSDPARVGRLVEAAVKAVSVPVTVKVRAGYELGERTAPAAVEAAIEAGATLVCVHGRTKMGWYREQVDHSAVAEVVAAARGRVPVIGNGDVVDLESALAMFHGAGCDAVMIGRGAVGNPWVFRQVDAYLREGRVLAPPGFAEVAALYEEHMDAVQAVFGERRGFSQVRRYAYYYFGRFGLDNGWRARIAGVRDRAGLSAVIQEIGAAAAGCAP
ncbi:MAG: tRNA dihydrouridine synthase [Planctomycetota bacterium]